MRTKKSRVLAWFLACGIMMAMFLGENKVCYAANVQGNVTVADVLGMDGAAYIDWLESHQNDDYYLGTPYCPGWVDGMSGDYRNPNGDCQGAYGEADKPGVAGMNCTGFVWHALYKPTLASGGNTSIIPAISGWVTFYKTHNVRRYYFSSKAEMLQSGVLEKGDIIWSFDGGSETALSDVHHVGIFWGDSSHEDKFWHSVNYDDITNEGWNDITEIQSKVPTNLWVVLKVGGVSRGYVTLDKKSADPSITGANQCYSLQGAVYGVFSDENCTKKVAEMATDQNGNTNTVEIKRGKYWVKEIQAPAGYLMDSNVYPITVSSNQTVTVEVREMPLVDTVELEILKVDQENQSACPQGAATLEGAQYTVVHYGGYYTQDEIDVGKPEQDGVPVRSWILETREEQTEDGIARYRAALSDNYLVSGDAFYTCEMLQGPVLPLGTVTIQETKAPEGYLLDESCQVVQITEEDQRAVIETGHSYTKSDRVIRGDVTFVKKDAKRQTPMANITFRITSNTTGESHIVTTDENGQFHSSAEYQKHSTGLWFGLDMDGNAVAADDRYGALPYDTYTIEELRCEGNEGKELVEPFVFTISKENHVVELGTIENEDISEIIEEQPEEEPETKLVYASKKSQPKTGDLVKTGYLYFLLLISGGLLLFRIFRFIADHK